MRKVEWKEKGTLRGPSIFFKRISIGFIIISSGFCFVFFFFVFVLVREKVYELSAKLRHAN